MVQFNPLLCAYLAFFILRSVTQVILDRVNIFYLRKCGDTVPEVFRDTIDREKLKKIRAYTIDSANFGILSTLASQVFFLLLLVSGFLPWLAQTIQQPGWSGIVQGLVFFAALSLPVNLFQIPFDLYDTFIIENRYGFNTKTLRLWIADLLKGLVLSALLGKILLGLFLSLTTHEGKY